MFQVLHIADSAFPIGGFAYSSGLEFAVKSGIISDIDGLKSYLKAFSDQLSVFDLSFVKAGFQATTHEQLDQQANLYDAMLLNPPLKKAGTVLGKNWLRIFAQLYPAHADAWPTDIDTNFPFVYGRSCQLIGLSLADTASLFMYMAMRDQISAAIRLGTLGPSLAHQIQHELLAVINESDYITQIPDIAQAYKSAYFVELAQLSHKYLYTKLFQN